MTSASIAQSPRTGAQPARTRLLRALIGILLFAAPLGAVGGLALAQRSQSGNGPTTLEAATALYATGQYGVAAQAYQQLVDQGYSGRALLYNRGIAQLEAGDAAAAVASLHAAQRAFPRDRDIRTALADAERRERMDAPTAADAAAPTPDAAAVAPGSIAQTPIAPAANAPAAQVDSALGLLEPLRLHWISGPEAALLALLLWTLLAALILGALAAPRHSGRRRLAATSALLSSAALLFALLLLMV